MDDLHKKYDEYMNLKNYKVEYELSNGDILNFNYKEEYFIHLLGLHKLKDILLIKYYNDKNNLKINHKKVIKKIKDESFTDAQVRASSFFSKIKTRYNNFSYTNLTTLSYTDAIINFDSTKFNSTLKSDYILFETKSGGYNHMGIAKDTTGNRYLETFFQEPTNLYLTGQQIVKVKRYTLYDAEGNVIINDIF